MAAKKQVDGFASVVKAFANDPEVTPPGTGKSFGSGALKVGKKIFAMVSSRSEFVVKLPQSAGEGARVALLPASRSEKPDSTPAAAGALLQPTPRCALTYSRSTALMRLW
jgi:hypothetical protein